MKTRTMAYLLIITGYNPLKAGGAGTDTRYFGTHGFCSAPTDTPPDTFFEPRISNPGLFSQSMFAPGTTGGASSGGFGLVDLVNTDGGLDYLADWGLDGGTFHLYSGDVANPFALFSLVGSGTIEQAEHTWKSINLRVKDKTKLLDVPLALHYYAGNNALPDGLEGGDDLKGKAKPRLFGTCFNISPVLINTSKLIYQLNDGTITTISAVRDNGVALTAGIARADSAALLANTPAAGAYDYCLATGMIRLGSAPVNPITADVTASAISIGQTIKALIQEKLGAGSVVEQSILSLDAAIPASTLFGYYSGANAVTVRQMLDVVSTAGIWWGFDQSGHFWAKTFSAPSTTHQLYSLTRDHITDVERTATNDGDRGVPVWKVTCRYRKNHTVQQTVAGSVNSSLYAQEWLSVSVEDASVKTAHPLAAELTIDTPYITLAAAQAEATRQLALRSVRRDWLRSTIPLKFIEYPDGGSWDNEAISDVPDYVYNAGCTVVGATLYITGGASKNPTQTISNKGYALNLLAAKSAYTTLPNLETTRHMHQLVPHGGYLYAVGGITGGYNTMSRCNIANPVSWDSSQLSELPVSKTRFACYVHGDLLFIIGGKTSAGVAELSVWSKDLSVFPHPDAGWSMDANPFTIPEWDQYADIPISITDFAHCKIGSVVYLIHHTECLSIDLAAPLSGWTRNALPIYPVSMASGAAVAIGSTIYVMGGFDGVSVQAACYRFTIGSSQVWEPITDLPDPRMSASAVAYNNSVYLIGGYTTEARPNTWLLRNNAEPGDMGELTSLGRTVLITAPRYGYDTGRPMLLIGTEADYADRSITLNLWG